MGKKSRSLITPVIGIVAVVLVVIVTGLLRKSRLDESSQALAISVTESIFVDEDFNVLVDSSHSSLLEQYTAENLILTMGSVTRILGPLEVINSISGSAESSLLPFASNPPRASYSIAMNFSGNSANAVIEMLYENDAWLLTMYRIDSQLLND
jgi:hypothetical protein